MEEDHLLLADLVWIPVESVSDQGDEVEAGPCRDGVGE